MIDVGATFAEREVESTRLLLEKVLRIVVSVPEAVIVEVATTGAASLFTVRVAAEDADGVIGRDGRTVQALRMIVGSIGLRHQHRFSLDVELGAAEQSAG